MGDLCGGWIETEEETNLRNHLKWAIIRVHSGGNSIPKEAKMENGGIIFVMQIWAEIPVRVCQRREYTYSFYPTVASTRTIG